MTLTSPPARPHRRAIVGGAMAAPFVVRSNQAAISTRPNILFILADDLGYADPSCYGQRDFSTPNIDRIARDGVRLTQGYANAAVCSATRIGLITGRYQDRLRAGLEEPIPRSAKGSSTIGLPPGEPTLPSRLRAAGYGTSLIGKWHMGYPPHFGPLKSGYEHFFGVHSGGVDYFTHTDTPGGAGEGLFEDDKPVARHGYLTDLLGRRAEEMLAIHRRDGRPFLMSLHFTAPHWPWEGPADEAESQRLKDLFDWDGGGGATYAAMVASLDVNVGRVLSALQREGLDANTIVVFTSDNGGERYSAVWPFSGAKTELLEGGLRVPTIARWPGRIPSSRVSEQVMVSMDWAPTLLDAAGVAYAAREFDGQSVLGQLRGEAPVRSRRLFWRYRANAQRAARDGDWKYLRIAENEFLFDLAHDPRERANLRTRQPEAFERLKAAWEAWNATMLPEMSDSYSSAADGSKVPDRYGAHSDQD